MILVVSDPFERWNGEENVVVELFGGLKVGELIFKIVSFLFREAKHLLTHSTVIDDGCIFISWGCGVNPFRSLVLEKSLVDSSPMTIFSSMPIMNQPIHLIRSTTQISRSNVARIAFSVNPRAFNSQLASSPTQDSSDTTPPHQDLRKAVATLPARPRRLDGLTSIPTPSGKHEADPFLLRSLSGTRSPVGASYTRARSPVFFPNVPLLLVRPSATDRSDPFTAIFRCDLRLTKPDIYNYLRQIYGLGITSLRTAIYRGRYMRKVQSKVRGGLTRARDGDRTFKKVWVGMDRPFFFPASRSEKWLDEQYMYSDSLNAYRRSRMEAEEDAAKDPRAVLPRGMENKGERVNVLRQVMESKKRAEAEIGASVRKSLKSADPEGAKEHQD